MASKRLRRLGFEADIKERLSRNGLLTCQDLLTKHRVELLKLLGQSDRINQDIFLTACRACAPQPVTALDLLHDDQAQPRFLPTTLEQLDHVLHGGIPAGTITEIAGPSGCGKTQYSIMLSVLATLPIHHGGLEGSVIYIDTESAFSAERLVEIAENRFQRLFKSQDDLVHLTSNVHVYLESTCSSLLKRLQNLEEDIITKNAKLIIIDSVASLVRKEFDSRTIKNITDRTNLLAKEAAILKYLAAAFSIPVVVTNQITTRFGVPKLVSPENQDETDGQADLANLDGDGSYVTAALGNTWSHSVNTRLIVQYLDAQRRQVMVAKSPIAPFAAFVYTIQASGIVLQEDGADHYEGTDPGLQRIRVRTSIPHAAFQF